MSYLSSSYGHFQHNGQAAASFKSKAKLEKMQKKKMYWFKKGKISLKRGATTPNAPPQLHHCTFNPFARAQLPISFITFSTKRK